MSEWVVIVYDKPGTSRAAVRAQHVADIKPNVEKGIIKNAGAIYHEIPNPLEGYQPFAGSSFNLVASSRQEILEFLKKDIYAKSGIWDLDNVLMYPYGCATREEKKLP